MSMENSRSLRKKFYKWAKNFLQVVSNSRGSTPECTDQNGVDGANGLNTGLGGVGVRVTAPPVIEKKKGLLGKKQVQMLWNF